MNIFLVNRHTRVDEELGRLEMFCALPVGRLTGSLATIKIAFGANLLIAVLTAVLLIVLGIGGTTVAGSFVFGFTIGAVGFVFAGLTLLLAQVFSTSRGVSGCGFALLGLFYIMRAIGDVGNEALSYLSPFGLGLKVEAFYSNEVMPIIVLLIEGFILSVAALAICAVRDHGAGVLPVRAGRAHASRFLGSSLGLAWRLSRGTTIGWAAGMLVLGISYGSVCTDINSFVEGNEMLQQMLGADGSRVLLDNYVALIFAMMSMVTAVPVVLTALRARGEERRGRLEQIFAKSTPRLHLFGSFAVVALLESVALQFLLALGLVVASNGALTLATVMPAALCFLPAIWTLASVAFALVGALPKLSALVWALFGYTFIVMYFGKIMDLPEWVIRISPFGNIPQLPLEDFVLAPLLILTLIAAAFTTLGFRSFTQRDIG
jgi:ABC-2 type transport system permease protein